MTRPRAATLPARLSQRPAVTRRNSLGSLTRLNPNANEGNQQADAAPARPVGARPVGARPLPTPPIQPSTAPTAPLRLQPRRQRADATNVRPPEMDAAVQQAQTDSARAGARVRIQPARARAIATNVRPPELETAIQQVQAEAERQRKLDAPAPNRQPPVLIDDENVVGDNQLAPEEQPADTILADNAVVPEHLPNRQRSGANATRPTPQTLLQAGSTKLRPRTDANDLAIPNVAKSSTNVPVIARDGVMTVEYFEANAKNIFAFKEKDRSDDYNNVLAALRNYHSKIDGLKQELNLINNKTIEKGKPRTALISQNAGLAKKMEITEFDIEALTEGVAKNEDSIRNEEDATRKESLQKKIDKDKATIAQLTQEVAQIRADITSNNEAIAVLTDQIDAFMKVETETAKKNHFVELDSAAKELSDANAKYLSKKESKPFQSKKTSTLVLLKGQLAGKASIFRDISKAQEDVIGVPIEQHLKAAPTRINTNTASDVFTVTINGDPSETRSNFGFAKKALVIGDRRNDTTDNLDIKTETKNGINVLKDHPNLIARQVGSYRLDEALGMGVTAFETFTKDVDGGLLGVSRRAEIDGKRGVATLRQDGNVFLYKNLDYKNSTTQKGLSDLQLMDALTGQLDRHMGNIFIEPESGRVISIDNDMAFPSETYITSDKLTNNQLGDQFSRDEKGILVYHQKLIDKESAASILAMTDSSMRKLLEQIVGDEKIPAASVNAAIERLNAIKAQIKKLSNEKALIEKGGWNEKTYKIAIDSGSTKSKKNPFSNYLARAVKKMEVANSGTDSDEKIDL